MSLDSFYQLLRESLTDPAMDPDHISDLMPLLCQLGEFQALRPYDDSERAQVLNEWVGGNPTSQIIEAHSSQYETGSGHIRNIGETAAWMLSTAARIAEIPGLLAEGETISEKLAELAQRCKFGVPGEVVPIAELGVLHRSELNLLVNNSTGKVLDTPHKILDADLNDFGGILSPQRAETVASGDS